MLPSIQTFDFDFILGTFWGSKGLFLGLGQCSKTVLSRNVFRFFPPTFCKIFSIFFKIFSFFQNIIKNIKKLSIFGAPRMSFFPVFSKKAPPHKKIPGSTPGFWVFSWSWTTFFYTFSTMLPFDFHPYIREGFKNKKKYTWLELRQTLELDLNPIKFEIGTN